MEGDRAFCSMEKLAEELGMSTEHARAVVDILDGVSPYQVVTSGLGGDPRGRSVDCHAMALYLMTQHYETLQKRDAEMSSKTVEVWPVQPPGSPSGPLSPARSPGAFPTASAGSPTDKQFKVALEQSLTGFVDFIKAHVALLLALCTPTPGAPPERVSRAVVDRLSLVLQPLASVTAPDGASEQALALSDAVPCFAGGAADAPAADVCAWVRSSLALPPVARGEGPGALLGALAPAEDLCGAAKETVVRGEDACPSGSMRIVGCQDTTVYALAPMHYCLIYGCSNCTIVVGAVGRTVRLERCEDVKLVVACKRVSVCSSHNCTLFLGTNRPPYLLGDARGIQVAPYCTRYERLQAHMDAVRVASLVNLWDRPLSLARPRGLGVDSPRSARSPTARPSSWGDGSGHPHSAPPPATCLPPEQLMPFVIPFRGGPGRTGGGVPASLRGRGADDSLGGAAMGATAEPGPPPPPSSCCPSPTPTVPPSFTTSGTTANVPNGAGGSA